MKIKATLRQSLKALLVDLPTMKDMDSWVESTALSSLLDASHTRAVDFRNISTTFVGDRFNLNQLAATLIKGNEGCLNAAAIAVLTLPRKFTRLKKSYNKELVLSETVLNHLNGNQVVSTSTATFVGTLIATDAALCVRVDSGFKDGDFLDILLDELLLEQQLISWNCDRAEFLKANRPKAPSNNSSLVTRNRNAKNGTRVYTLIAKDGRVLLRNWCIPHAVIEGEPLFIRKRRIQDMIQSRNRYTPIENISMNGK